MKTSVIFWACAAAAAPLTAQTPAQIDAIFAAYDRKDVPGCALGVIRDGQLAYQKGYGSANLDYALPNGQQMVYYVGSVSKQFTAAAIALLSLDGKLSLDKPVSDYIPEMAHLPRMTVRQLVHHTGGVRDIYGLMSLAGIRMEDVLPEADAIGLIARQKELNFKPGDDYLYSNSGYLLLAQIVKRVSGKSLREFADERIFTPLGMKNTHFHDEPYHVFPNRVISYSPTGPNAYRISYLLNFDKTGAGGLYTTLGDLLLWDRNFYDNKLGRGFLELMHSRGVLNRGDTLAYAFGLQIGKYRGLNTVRHSGSLMGFQADLVRFPDQRFSVAALCNANNIVPTNLANQVAELYLGDRMGPRPTAAGGRAGAPPQVQRPTNESVNPADYAGSYRSDELGVTYTVQTAGAELRVIGGLPRERTLTAGERDTFRSGGNTYRFERNSAGRVTGFTVEAGRVRNIRFGRTD
ncbi:MAG: serine hydrolase domain-containing protein [Gemmatimonadota bacterium]